MPQTLPLGLSEEMGASKVMHIPPRQHLFITYLEVIEGILLKQ